MRLASFFATGASALTLFSALPSACGAAIDNEIVKRNSATDCVSILNSATRQIAPIKLELLAKLDLQLDLSVSLAKEDFLKNDILPLLKQINTIVAQAASKITALKSSSSSSSSSSYSSVQVTAVATALALLVKEIVAAIQPLLKFLSSIALIKTILGGTLASLGSNLNIIAIGLGIIVGGVLKIVKTLLADLTSALSGLGYSGLLATLGL